MTLPNDLIKAADRLLITPVTLTMGRRAVSTAYYAVFHTVLQLCAAELLGAEFDAASPEYVTVYRALAHEGMRKSFQSGPLKDIAEIKAIGNRVLALQTERNDADYMPMRKGMYTLRQCRDIVQSARETIAEIEGLSPELRRTLAVNLLFKKR